MTIKYAIWAAVSRDFQAEDDKVSLAEQVNIARARAENKGWQESAGPYIVPGESRTKYVNLRDAENDLPQLHQCLNDAQAGHYHLLMLYDYNRLRDLIDPVAKTLAAYGVQVYSVSQPVEPAEPGEYSPYSSDSESIMRGMAQILSRAQISDLRRKYAYAMPKRILERGLPQAVPYGYLRAAARGGVATPDPEKTPILILAKDMVLAGQSLRQVIDEFSKRGYPGPEGGRWHPGTITRMLRNPFYAGLVRWRNTQTVNDPRSGERWQIKTPERAVVGTVKHTPLWTIEEHQKLLYELRRTHTYRGKRANMFTSLLVCGSCGGRMGITEGFMRGTKLLRIEKAWYRCRSHKPDCSKIRHPHLMERFAAEFLRVLLADEQAPALVVDELALQLADAQERAKRLTAGYLAGAITLDEFAPLKAVIDGEINTLQLRAQASQKAIDDAQERAGLLAFIRANAADLPAALGAADQQRVNRILTGIIKTITINRDGGVIITLL